MSEITFRNAPRPGEPADAPITQVVTLGAIRHACHACGTCCTGWRVQLPTIEDRRRLQAQAEVLGVADPIVDGVIRRADGRCVFLREDNLCAIHAHFGEDEKPTVCKNFPRRSRHAEDGMRIGADPGCSSSWRSFRDGPELTPWPVKSSRPSPMEAERASSETALITLCRAPEMTVPLFIAVMTGHHGDLPNPDAAFTRRALSRLSAIAPYLADADNGSHLNTTLAPIAAHLLHFNADAPLPAWELPPDADAFALDLMQRFLFLRIGTDLIPPVAHTILLLGGILACAYVDPTPSVFGPALSAWSRLTRLQNFWEPVLPDRAAGQWILYGPAGVTPPD